MDKISILIQSVLADNKSDLQAQLDKLAKGLKLNINATVKGIEGMSNATGSSAKSTQQATQALNTYEKALNNVIHKYKMKQVEDDKFLSMSKKIMEMSQFQELSWKKQEQYINLVAKAEANYTKVRNEGYKTSQKITDTDSKNSSDKQTKIYSQIESTLKNIYNIKTKIVNLEDGAEKQALQSNLKLEELRFQKLNTRKVASNLGNPEREVQLIKLQGDLQSKLHVVEGKSLDIEKKKTEEIERQNKRLREREIELNSRVSNSLYKQKQSETSSSLRIEDIKTTKLAQLDKMQIGADKVFSDPRVKSEMESLIKSINSMGEVGGKSVSRVNAEMSKFKTTVSQVGFETKQLNKETHSYFGNLGMLVKKFADWMIVGTLFMQSVNFIRNGLSTIVELDTSLTNLKKVSDELGKSVGMKEFTQQANEMAISVGHSTKAALDSITDFKKLGYSLMESKDLAEQALIYSNISDQDIGESTKSIISTLKGFQLGVEDVTHVMDSYNEVGNNFSITSAGIGAALQRSSSSLFEANNTLEQSIGLITAANASIQDPERVGNGLKTVAMRLRGINEENGELIPSLRESIKLMSGVDIMKDKNTFKSTYDSLVDISKVYKSLSDTTQANLVEIMFGKHQGAVGASLLNNMADGIKATETAINSAGSAAREQAAYMDSINAKINTFKETVTKLWVDTINSEVIKGTVSFGTAIVSLIDKFGLLNTSIIAITIAMTLFTKSFAAGLIEKVAISIAALATQMGVATGTATALGTAMGFIAPVAIVAAIMGVVKAIDYFNVSVKEASESINSGFNKSQENIKNLQSLASEYESLAKKEKKNAEDKERLVQIQMQVNSQYSYGQKNMDLYSSAISNNTDEINTNVEAIKARAKAEADNYIQMNKYNYQVSKGFLNDNYSVNVAGKYTKDFKNAQEALKFFGEEMVSASEKGNKLAYSYNKQKYDDLKKKVESATEAIAKYEGYQELLKTTQEEVNNSTENVNQSFGDYTKSLEEANKSIDDFQSNAKNISSIFETINNGEKISADTLLDLIQNYPTLTSEILNANTSKEAGVKLTEALFDIEKQRAIQKLEDNKKILESEISILEATAANMAGSTSWASSLPKEAQLSIFGGSDYSDKKAQLDGITKSIEYLKGLKLPSYSTSKSGSSKDPYKNSVESQINDLQYLRDKDKISEAEYYNQLEKLNNKYFANKKKYLDDYRKYEIEVYNGRKKLEEDFFNNSLSKLKDNLDSGKINLDKYITSLENLKKTSTLTKDNLEQLNKTIEEAKLDKIANAFDEADGKLQNVNNQISKLGNINTEEERTKEAELLAQKYKLAKEELDKINEKLASTKLSPDARKLYEDRKIKLELNIADFQKDIENAMQSLLELQKANELSAAENKYNEQLREQEEKIYGKGSSQDIYEAQAEKRISAIQKVIDNLEKEKDLADEIAERNKRILDIEKQKLLISNLEKEKDRRVYRSDANGGLGGFVYESNQSKIIEESDKLKEMQDDFASWEKDNQIKALQATIENERAIMDEKSKAYALQKAVLDLSLKQEQLAIENHYKDIDSLVITEMDKLKTIYGEQWDKIIKVIEEKLGVARDLSKSLDAERIKAEQNAAAIALAAAQSAAGVVTSALTAATNAAKTVAQQNEDRFRAGGRYVEYDTGGELPSGGTGINRSGKPERILSPTQTQDFNTLVKYLPDLTKLLKSIDISKIFTVPKFNFPTLSPAVVGENSGGVTYSFPNMTVVANDVDALVSFARNHSRTHK